MRHVHARTVTTVALCRALTIAPATAPTANAQDDGVWAPNHDESLAVIPLCRSPPATSDWPDKNHGDDSASFIADNHAEFERLPAGPYEVLAYLVKPFPRVVVYAMDDILFHIPPTIGDLLTFCSSTWRG